MKIIRFLLAAVLLWAPSAGRAQTIEGVVLEDSTRNPIVDARVELVPGTGGRRASLRTDSAGVFRFDSVGAGRFVLRFRHPSYTPVDSVAVQISRGERVEIELRMGHSAVLLEPLIVRARAHEGVGGFRDRMRTNGFGRFMGREQIERRSAMRVTDLLRTVPGVQLVSTGVGSTYVLMRGGAGQCAPDIYLDGSRLRQSREVDVDAFVTPASLEGVEVYTSASATPSVFASSSACGVVAFWTRPAPPGRWSWRWFGAGLGAIGLLFLLAL